jgi:hypothetical protein
MPIGPISTSPTQTPSAADVPQVASESDIQRFQAAMTEAEAMAKFELKLREDILRNIIKDGNARLQKVFTK